MSKDSVFLRWDEDYPESLDPDSTYYYDIFSIPRIWLKVIKTQTFKDRFDLPINIGINLPFGLFEGAYDIESMPQYTDDDAFPAVVWVLNDEFQSTDRRLIGYQGFCQLNDYMTPDLDDDLFEVFENFVKVAFSLYSRKNYKHYLGSEYWKKLRRECFARDGFRCVKCGSAMNLNAHHLNYDKLGDYDELENLITLCGACHTEVHKFDIERKNT